LKGKEMFNKINNITKIEFDLIVCHVVSGCFSLRPREPSDCSYVFQTPSNREDPQAFPHTYRYLK